MKRIFKYVLDFSDKQIVNMPEGCTILSVANQNDTIVVYALVDDTQRNLVPVEFIIHGTGHIADDVDAHKFLGTVSIRGGRLMFHVFFKL